MVTVRPTLKVALVYPAHPLTFSASLKSPHNFPFNWRPTGDGQVGVEWWIAAQHRVSQV